ncbi:uncharacterized protein F4822DRAFT_430840 [Hypoxylon trugodes]|uniref:uncharacterized protein n=1 Tax=Hypoxylon trugodes TaxID=326681 RepID=UPI00219C863D|nr:uncharacterized protein F4822DRAFT_430840 [Hypoxylon trugodes]KAI1388086.1 hypothetical protein F4822DRAFT_430840 [Hypoxylon trugodes]
MADETPPGDHRSPVGKLNNAISDFATSYVKNELQQLTRESDDALARSHVPKLRALLREVDRERHAFEQGKEKLIYDLRKKLELLEVDAQTIEATLAELSPFIPKYLRIIPSASTLTVRPPTPPVRDNYFNTVLSADLISSAPPPPDTPVIEQGMPSTPSKAHRPSPSTINVSPGAVPNIDYQVQNQILSENSTAHQHSKRASLDEDGSASAKRRKVDKKALSRSQSDIFRKIAFPNLETKERIFRHSERPGFFVIRCNRPNCPTGFFTDPPLAYNRAVKHFQSHGEVGEDDEELTNEYIFEHFACEIEGSSLVSKYWIKEHLGPVPHTFIPGKSRPRNSQGDSPTSRKRQDDDKNYTPSNRPEIHTVDDSDGDEDEEDVEVEKPRRTPRSVPRPDYAELVANKDPWSTVDLDSDRSIPRIMKEHRLPTNGISKSSRSGSSRSSSISKRSTPGPSSTRAKTTEPNRLGIPQNNGRGDPRPARDNRHFRTPRVSLIDGHLLKITLDLMRG